ncbi:EAL domain-containing protein [Sporosarcina sp. Marseille-Q4063]|uniref:EAL domain-containing protein n=1 Tax=Sporosarcina sp. Marseille-Q4063 TaxID=2810514 RepID=UPI00201685A6|nr:EAL domain-containing protein [Sporosarcina sp. Marseille-Q4063]
MVGSYNYPLVILSIVIVVIASYTAHGFYLRHLSTDYYHKRWFVSGAVVLGLGIWCMQFIGNLAYTPTNDLYLDMVYVGFALMIAIILSFFSTDLLKFKNGIILGSIAFGITVCSTTFISWNAYHEDIDINLNLPVFLFAAAIGCVGIYSALSWVKKLLRNNKGIPFVKLVGGISFGLSLAIFLFLLRMSLTVVNLEITDLSVNMLPFSIVLGIVFSALFIFFLFESFLLDKITAQSIKTQTLEQSYQSLFEQNPDMIITFDLDGKFLSVNRVVELYGFTEEEILHQSFISLIVPDRLEKTLKHFDMAKNGQRVNYNSAFYGKTGEQFEVYISNFPIVVNDQIVGVYAVIKDITAFKKAQVILAEAEDKYRSLTENSVVGSYITQEGKFVYANQKLMELLGSNEEELLGASVLAFIHPEDHHVILENIKNRINDISKTAHYQYRMVKKDNTVIYVETFGSAMIYQGKPAAIGTIVDITGRKAAEETIEYLAFHDSLTGLLNRNAFSNSLKNSLSKESMALLYIDLDEFGLIDDALGHEIGDRLLKDVSERLKNCVPVHGEIGRNRGDEFLVYLPNMGSVEAATVAENMIASLSNPFHLNQYELYVTPSIGISLYPNDAKNEADLIKMAEAAMYQAKKSGKNAYQSYNLSYSEQSHDRFELEMSLRKALEREEFLLYYQPKFDLASGKVNGVEALIRWNHPIKGFVSPGDFIPLAEELGLIVPIGEWVLRTACKQTKAWQEAGLPLFEVSVNLSVRQLYRPNLVEMVGEVLRETGLDPKYLELEITESMLADSDQALNVLHELKALGLKISLDDFGTGFSSLHYLKEAPFDKLKIDQSFIRNCSVDNNSATIVKTIIAMAHQLNLEVIAEGVETKEHLIFIQQNLCDGAQGYLFSKPVPPEELVERFSDMEQIVHQYGIKKD